MYVMEMNLEDIIAEKDEKEGQKAKTGSRKTGGQTFVMGFISAFVLSAGTFYDVA